jgi:KDO2-lipid IV(A) lauroyltransferase
MIKKGFSYIGILFLYGLALLPLPILYAFSSITYYIVYYITGYRKKVVRENLLNSFPEKNIQEIIAIEKRYYKYLCNLIFEIIKMPLLSKKELIKRYKFNNIHLIQDRIKNGESCIICSAHYGNWEWGMLAFSLYIPAEKYVIFKPLNNAVFNQWFYHMRARFGSKFISMAQTPRTVVATKKETSIFCFASDQSPVRHPANHWLTFLHQPTMVFLGPEKIAVQTNRPVYYFKVTVVKRGFYEVDCVQITAQPKETREHEITAAQFKILEDVIHQAPEYWLWSHRRWKHKPEKI